MTDKIVLHYFNGRGKMEPIRWLLTFARVEYEETYLTSHEQYQDMLKEGDLLFQQVPMVEIDGMKLVQTKAILNYIADKYGLHGKTIKDRAMINMYSEGLMDLMDMITSLLFCDNVKEKLENIENKAKTRYLPVFEKVLIETVHLVGGKTSMADVLLFQCTLMLEERLCGIMADFPNIKSFQGRMIKAHASYICVRPVSFKKPTPDEEMVRTALKVFNITKVPSP